MTGWFSFDDREATAGDLAGADAVVRWLRAAGVDHDVAIVRAHAQPEYGDGRHADVVMTSRLHGMVLALKRGTPAFAIDRVAGGAKVLAQARTLGWPHVVTADALTAARLDQLLDAALAEESRELAGRVAGRARQRLENVAREFRAAVTETSAQRGR